MPPLESEETVHLTHDEQESILEAKRDRIPHPRAVDMVPYYENVRCGFLAFMFACSSLTGYRPNDSFVDT